MTEQYGGPYGTSEGREIRHDVVDGGDESLIHNMGTSYEDAAGDGLGFAVQCRRGDLNPHALSGTSPSIPFLAIRLPGQLRILPAQEPFLATRRDTERHAFPFR